MWNEPAEVDLAHIPALYATEHVPLAEKLIPMHFFLGACDWYAAEYSPQDRIFFGYAILNDDFQNAEWGYVSFDELRELKTPNGLEIERDLHWKTRKASEIERIVQSSGV